MLSPKKRQLSISRISNYLHTPQSALPHLIAALPFGSQPGIKCYDNEYQPRKPMLNYSLL